jgi:hypothetical protein
VLNFPACWGILPQTPMPLWGYAIEMRCISRIGYAETIIFIDWRITIMNNLVNESMNESLGNNNESLIPADCLDDFKQAMKVGYYKMMKSKGLISESQFEILMKMQTVKVSV